MIFKRLICLYITFALFTSHANAELKLISTKSQHGDSACGQITMAGGSGYWMLMNYEFNKKPSLQLFKFTEKGFNKQQSLLLNYYPMLFAKQVTSASQSKPLLVDADFDGKWHISQLDIVNAKVINSAILNEFSLVVEAVENKGQYFIGGIDKEDFPLLMIYDKSLKKQQQVKLNSQVHGEISSVFLASNKIYAIANFSNATAEINEISSSGTVLKYKKLAGGAATGVALRDGGFAITYRVGKQVFVEKLDGQWNSVWVTKLFLVQGVTTKTNQLIELRNGIALVGSNNDQLTIFRLNDKGSVTQRSVDARSGLSTPSSEAYSVVPLQNELHVRGQSSTDDDLTNNNITSFYFTEK